MSDKVNASGGGTRRKVEPAKSPSAPQVLGDVFGALKFGTDDKKRLGGLLGKGGIVAYIIRTYATRTKAYKAGFRKSERIAGFRNETAPFDQQAVPVILRYLADANHPRHDICWNDIYRVSATDFISAEMPQMHRLLTEVPAPSESLETTELLRTLCLHAFEYGVTPQDVSRLYEVWAIPRVADLEALLPLCLKRDEVTYLRRGFAKLSEDFQSLQTLLKTRPDSAEIPSTADAASAHIEALRSEMLEAMRAQGRAFEDATSASVEGLRALVSSAAARADEELGRVSREVAGARAELATLLESEHNARARMSTDFGLRIDELLRQAERSAREAREFEVHVSRALTEIAATRTDDAPGSDAKKPELTWTSSTLRLDEPIGLKRALAGSFRANGVAPTHAVQLHSALAAGLTTVVYGHAALSAIEAYGHVACSGRVAVVIVSPSMAEPRDLLERRADFLDQSTTVIELIELAGKTSAPVILALEGLNRAATESYLLPLLLARSSGRSLSTFDHQSNVTARLPAWPTNLWLAGTAADGASCLPLSRDVLATSVLIEVDSAEVRSARVPGSELTLASLAAAIPTERPTSFVDELVEGLPDARSVRTLLETFGGMLSRFESDPRRLKAALAATVMLPLLLTLGDHTQRDEVLEQLRDAAQIDDPQEWARLIRRVQRLVA